MIAALSDTWGSVVGGVIGLVWGLGPLLAFRGLVGATWKQYLGYYVSAIGGAAVSFALLLWVGVLQ